MDYAKESLRLHGEWKGKIEMVTRVPVKTRRERRTRRFSSPTWTRSTTRSTTT